MEFKYKLDNPNSQSRREECQRILDEFPEKIPVICEKDIRSSIPHCPKNKFLVEIDLPFCKFQEMLRFKIQLTKESSLFILVGGKYSVSTDMLMGDIYKKYKDEEDGFLYIIYSSELTWG
jgi:GABA(A) receptor-associated protein